LASQIYIGAYSFYNRAYDTPSSSGTRFPERVLTRWTLWGSVDGVVWSVVDGRDGQTTSHTGINRYVVQQPGLYSYYRMGNFAPQPFAAVAELNLEAFA